MDAELVAAVRAAGVRLVAVTKGQSVESAREAVAAGVVDLGENDAQSLIGKAIELPEARWNFLGAVQRRKVRGLAPHVAVWQTVARAEEGEAIARAVPEATVLVQVTVSGLPNRNGCSWDELDGLVAALRSRELDVQGLMGVAVPGEERAQFRRLATAARDLGLPELSMGMSGDWRIAVEEGATIVRLGSALFGPRPDPLDLRR
jgi:PLP dependent protein